MYKKLLKTVRKYHHEEKIDESGHQIRVNRRKKRIKRVQVGATGSQGAHSSQQSNQNSQNITSTFKNIMSSDTVKTEIGSQTVSRRLSQEGLKGENQESTCPQINIVNVD